MKKGTWVVIFYDLKDEMYDKAIAYQIGDDTEQSKLDINEQMDTIYSEYNEGENDDTDDESDQLDELPKRS